MDIGVSGEAALSSACAVSPAVATASDLSDQSQLEAATSGLAVASVLECTVVNHCAHPQVTDVLDTQCFCAV